jgi:Ca2+-binding EF-hand superfamily protein
MTAASQLLTRFKQELNKQWAQDGHETSYTESVHKTFWKIDTSSQSRNAKKTAATAASTAKEITSHEFYIGMRNVLSDVTVADSEGVFKLFDTNKTGSIDFNEFMSKIQVQMNKTRYNAVRRVFDKADVNKSNVITVSDFVKFRHNNRGAWFMTHVIGNYNADDENKLTYSEFINYYSDLSMSYPDDDAFIQKVSDDWDTRSIS